MSNRDVEERNAQAYFEMVEHVQGKKIELTDEQWMNILVRDRDGLPPCCANISTLRDALISIALDGGHIDMLRARPLVTALTWCFPDHDVPSPELDSILSQLEWQWFGTHAAGRER